MVQENSSELEKVLERVDLNWLADFERSICNVAVQMNILENFSEFLKIDKVSASHGINKEILELLTPVLIHAEVLTPFLEMTSFTKQILLKSSPYFRPDFFKPEKWDSTERLKGMLKSENKHLKGQGETYSSMWSKGKIDLGSAKTFSNSMLKTSLLPARIHNLKKPFKGINTFTDLGGGGGAWALAALEQHETVKYIIYDLANVNQATASLITTANPEIAEKVT
jgi:hypothetical protein